MTGRRARAYVGLGANVGDAPRTLTGAVHALATLPGVSLRGVSRLYVTRPVGVADQPDFHNAVAGLDVPDGPDPATGALAFVIALKRIEAAFGRRRRERWGPRELDLDLLVFGDHLVRVERPPTAAAADAEQDDIRWLEVPHPAARERLFVLAPLADLAPELQPPGWGDTIGDARDRREQVEGAGAVRAIADWDEPSGSWKA